MADDGSRRGLLVIALTAGVALATLAVTAGWTGPLSTNLLIESLVAWGTTGAVAGLWLAMALGFGATLWPLLRPDGRAQGRAIEQWAMLGALGVAAALLLDMALGATGLLALGRGLVAWGVTLAGCLLFVLHLRRGTPPGLGLARSTSSLAPIVAAGIPIGVLLLAATSAPGWLWRSEFGGYDALSYHLQLPKEWLALGRTETLTHSVYSALPSAVETAFLHCFLLAGGPERGAIAAQQLVALVTLLSALGVAALARRVTTTLGAALAAALWLATPWTVVVGSLAYNDGFVSLFLIGGLLLVMAAPTERMSERLRVGGALGILVAAACGAKLTAAGFLLLPLIAVAILRQRRAAWVTLACAAAIATIGLLPWLVRNAIATGNPFFPFATDAFGLGHWTAEQAQQFREGHGSPGIGSGVRRLWSQWIAFGVGTAPNPQDPWLVQWSILPIAGLIAGGALLVRAAQRRWRVWPTALLLVIAVQCAFWILLTHQQSRFLLPTAVPLAVLAAWGIVRAPRPAIVATLVAFAASTAPLFLLRGEGLVPMMEGGERVVRSAPAIFIGAAPICTGDGARDAISRAPNETARRAAEQSAPLSFFLNHAIPAKDRVLLVGDAKPFWYRRGDETLSYATVWDRGALSAVAALDPDRPEAWSARLLDQGYTWVVIDWAMLANWANKGWLDPNLTEERMQRFASSMTLAGRLPGGVELRSLRPPQQR
jgi:hypothetical protein